MEVLQKINVIIGGIVFLLGLHLLFITKVKGRYDQIIIGVFLIHGFFDVCISLAPNANHLQDSVFIMYQYLYPLLALILIFIKRKVIKKFIILGLILILVCSMIVRPYAGPIVYTHIMKYSFFLFFFTSLAYLFVAVKDFKRYGIRNYFLILIAWMFTIDAITLSSLNQVISFEMDVWLKYFIYYLFYIDIIRILFIYYYGRTIFRKSLANTR